jgi:hypothetical protein
MRMHSLPFLLHPAVTRISPATPPGIASQIAHDLWFQIAGYTLTVLVTFIGIRMVCYWTSFTFQSDRYRQRRPVTTPDLRRLAKDFAIPYIKVQITTKGSPGSTDVILRGLRQLENLASEDPDFYARFLTAEVFTENPEQAGLIEKMFASSPLARVDCVVTPEGYETPKGTRLKAWQMHYAVTLRRAGWNKRPGRTFIAHWDEDTLMIPAEFRKMIACLTTTTRKVLTGPIYYPLEYDEASRLARATEATRLITCFECRRVMETGKILHIHGSNLVIEEELENRVGWDIGTLNGVPFVAEDYMFGMAAFLQEGQDVFGWHGAVAWEQPPFSFKSVYHQRYRWVFGVLQGMSVDKHLDIFRHLPWSLRMKVIWGTRYRIATYALGTLVGVLSLMFMGPALYVVGSQLSSGHIAGLSPWLDAWFALVGFMWLGANLVGAWGNVLHAGRTRLSMVAEVARAIVYSPVAGLMENMAALSAVTKWMCGVRAMVWNTTPSTKSADDALHGRSIAAKRPLAETVREPALPGRTGQSPAGFTAIPLVLMALLIAAVYIGTPLLLAVQEVLRTSGVLLPALAAAVIFTAVAGSILLRMRKLTSVAVPGRGRHRLGMRRHTEVEAPLPRVPLLWDNQVESTVTMRAVPDPE